MTPANPALAWLRARADEADLNHDATTAGHARAVLAMVEGEPCHRCHGERYVTNGAGEPDDCPRCGLSGIEPPAGEVDIHALLREYIDAGCAAARAEDAEGRYGADAEPDVGRAWGRVAHLRTKVGAYIVGLQDANIAAERRGEGLRIALTALYGECAAAGHGDDRDFGWPKAMGEAREALGLPEEHGQLRVVMVPKGRAAAPGGSDV